MLTRGQVLAYRAAAAGLSGPAAGPGAVLAVGVQDHPAGTTARLAVALRGDGDHGDHGDGDHGDGGDGVLVHSVRAALHLHRIDDLGLLAGALHIDDGAALAKQAISPFGAEIGAAFGAAVDEVAGVMRDVMADGERRTKGELSGAVSPRVTPALAPWCGGCGVHHVQDALFRYATLQAGLIADVESAQVFRYRQAPAGACRTVAVADARAELVRRYVHVAGPVRPAHLATWLSLTPAAARDWWALAESELTEVEAGGRRGSVLAADVAALEDPPEPDELRLLGPYDPLTELADRELVLPDAGRRTQVWAAAANPGIVLHAGEIVATWRRRTARGRLTLTAAPFGPLPRGWSSTESVRADADVIGRSFGASEVRIETAS
ncbi:DNA glycosylase AlkZ-like family protein [Jiangella ureilytica]|nr:crosslink repair DNA glycosylase YcaQ family protein [Jiangella ureilytica]